jgi:chorismate mutase
MGAVCRGVRGATTVTQDDREEILRATRELLALIIYLNGIDSEAVASAIFTTTTDLCAAFPATAARQLGWFDVPLMCSHEIDVPGSLDKCIRVLIHWNTDKPQHDIQHVYLKEAQALRPDKTVALSSVDMEELDRWIEEQLHTWDVSR